ncbi:MAG TPA: DNA-directed RNA polymerase subunit K [Candidatus Nanoarchaeia archaeon]|nr:DNA-directed RNA polymerase subunit K [Candidatus Nanoarchaeia archaeon]
MEKVIEKKKHDQFTKYEVARILGARALQISMDAPLLKKLSPEEIESVNYEPMKIAKIEFEADVLPITVKQPMPKKKSVKVKKTSIIEKTVDKEKDSDREVSESEEIEEKEIIEEGEIMELSNPEDEESFEEVGGREGSEELM